MGLWIALQLSCRQCFAVLSQDSDYFVFDIARYCPLDSLNPRERGRLTLGAHRPRCSNCLLTGDSVAYERDRKLNYLRLEVTRWCPYFVSLQLSYLL